MEPEKLLNSKSNLTCLLLVELKCRKIAFLKIKGEITNNTTAYM
jgi:hypothetical protein